MTAPTINILRCYHAPSRVALEISGKAYVYAVNPPQLDTIRFYLRKGWYGKLLQFPKVLDRDKMSESMAALEFGLANPNDIGDLNDKS